MNIKILSILLAATLLTTPVVEKEKKEKAKTEQVKKAPKEKKVKNPNGFSNSKLYTLTCRRGQLVMNVNRTGLTSTVIRTDAPKEDKTFAIITHEGKQYIGMLFNKLLQLPYHEYNLYYHEKDDINLKTVYRITNGDAEKWIVYSNNSGFISTSKEKLNMILNQGWITNSKSLPETLDSSDKKITR